jgi:hypothetical protein
LTREFIPNLLDKDQKLSFTIKKDYYLIAHLTQADLSMLNDFEMIKDELSIVNGSYVTIRESINYCNKNIYVRDTMLLAPSGSKRLAQIGNLYGDKYEKIVITQTDLEDMQGFLDRDRDKFTQYAIRDALISLVHAL